MKMINDLGAPISLKILGKFIEFNVDKPKMIQIAKDLGEVKNL